MTVVGYIKGGGHSCQSMIRNSIAQKRNYRQTQVFLVPLCGGIGDRDQRDAGMLSAILRARFDIPEVGKSLAHTCARWLQGSKPILEEGWLSCLANTDSGSNSSRLVPAIILGRRIRLDKYARRRLLAEFWHGTSWRIGAIIGSRWILISQLWNRDLFIKAVHRVDPFWVTVRYELRDA